MTWIPDDIFNLIVKYSPLPCVDIFIEFKDNGYLWVKRNIPPQKGKWAPIGGIIKRNESIEHACKRIIYNETNLKNIKIMEYLGATEYIGKERHCISINFRAETSNQTPNIQIGPNENVLEWEISYKPPKKLAKQYKSIIERLKL